MQPRLRRRALGAAAVALAVGLSPAAAMLAPAAADAEGTASSHRYLVTMTAPGTAGYRGPLSETAYRADLVAAQDALLRTLDAGPAESRWTTALSGVAVSLTPAQAAQARDLPTVRLVEADSVRKLAGAAPGGLATAATAPPARGGRGTVIGFVDTGLHTEGPVFAPTDRLGPTPTRFRGDCAEESLCNEKVVAAHHFLDAFGEESLRAGASATAHDDQGHGTMVASLAAGNVTSTSLRGRSALRQFAGTAPDARVAVYKACWEAPDPDDDGCASADVVSAIDRATHDRVDVLNLSVAGRAGLDTVDLALLGAAEADVVVVAAAGNSSQATGHDVPWVTTVGAATDGGHQGRLVLSDRTVPTDSTVFRGLLTTAGTGGRHRLVAGRDIPAPGATRTEARLCAPGALDTAAAADRIVVCDRGVISRIAKSRSVALADGAGLILVDGVDDEIAADLHAVPTLAVDAATGRRLAAAMRAGAVRGSLTVAPDDRAQTRPLAWSAPGSATGSSAKPDLLAPGLGLLAATSPTAGAERWNVLSGTSAAAAQVSGAAARLRARHRDWSAARIRSAVTTRTDHLPGVGALRQGTGMLDARATSPGLVYDVAATRYRRLLDDAATPLNTASVRVAAQRRPIVVRRTVTNVRDRARYWSVDVRGLPGHRVRVTPAAVRLAPGEKATYRVEITRRAGARRSPDSGWVVWRDAADQEIRIPVVVGR